MTVEELIKELSKYDLDQEVYVACGGDDGKDILKIEEGVAAIFIISAEE